MCEHCGCRGVPPIAELMEEHDAILDDVHQVRSALAEGDRIAVAAQLKHLVAHLEPHVAREEQGLFTALRNEGEFVDEVVALEVEHHDLDAAIAALDPDAAGFDQAVSALLATLEEHVERENLGVFPVSVVTLGAKGWNTVERARESIPTFLPGGASTASLADR